MRSRTRSLVLSAIAAGLVLLVAAFVWLLLPRPPAADAGPTDGVGEPQAATPVSAEAEAAADSAADDAAGSGDQPSPAPAEPSPDAAAEDELRFSLYVDPRSPAQQWLEANPEAELAETLAREVVAYPAASWLQAGEASAVTAQVTELVDRAAAEGATPALVSVAPGLSDCEPTLTGPQAGAEQVAQWYEAIGGAIGESSVIIVLEPYALRVLSCVREEPERQARLTALAAAVGGLGEAAPNALVYLGGGGSDHPDADARVMAGRLAAAGVAQARGFLVNATSARPVSEAQAYAAEVNDELAEELGRAVPIAVDTSRNGADPVPEPSCNSAQLRVGLHPGLTGGSEPAAGRPEVRLWLLQPGVSAGNCGIGLGSSWGEFLPELAALMVGEEV